jgi:hypothetical protein
MRNYRIGANGFLNQRCALMPNLESILRARVRKIFLQKYLPIADFRNTGGVKQKDRLAAVSPKSHRVR